jgi:hypothetical protein
MPPCRYPKASNNIGLLNAHPERNFIFDPVTEQTVH